MTEILCVQPTIKLIKLLQKKKKKTQLQTVMPFTATEFLFSFFLLTYQTFKGVLVAIQRWGFYFIWMKVDTMVTIVYMRTR